MITVSVSKARTRLDCLIDQVSQSRQPIRIVGPRSTAVLVSECDWRGTQETLHLLSIPGMDESIKAGREEPLERSADRLAW